MKQYNAKNILNIALAGHAGCGKTSLAESMLFLAKASDRLGSVTDGNTVLDFDAEEIKRGVSLNTAVAPIEWKNTKINLIDTPGLFDFEGGVAEGMRAADTALIVVSGKDGVGVGTEKAVKAATKQGIAKVFFVNGVCDENARFYRVFEDLKSTFGPSVCPVVVPFIENGKAEVYVNLFEYRAYKYVKGVATPTDMPDLGDRLEGLREAIKEAVAETSEELLDKFLEGEEFTPEEIVLGVSQGVKDGSICPVFCGDAHNTFAIDMFLNSLVWLAPKSDSRSELGVDPNGEPVEISVNIDGAAAGIVFKTVSDPFVGKLSYIKTVSGKIGSDVPVINMRTGEPVRITKVLTVRGKKQEDAQFIGAGDIGAIPKLNDVKTGDTLCSPLRKVTLDGINYPVSSYAMAIKPKKKGDEDKVAQAVKKIIEEDPSVKYFHNHETHEMIIYGLGEQQSVVRHVCGVINFKEPQFLLFAFTVSAASRKTFKQFRSGFGRILTISQEPVIRADPFQPHALRSVSGGNSERESGAHKAEFIRSIVRRLRGRRQYSRELFPALHPFALHHIEANGNFREPSCELPHMCKPLEIHGRIG